MKKSVLIMLILLPFMASAQDIITFRNGDTLNCKVLKTDSLSLYYSFRKNDRNIESYVKKNEIKSYQLNYNADNLRDTTTSIIPNVTKTVVLDSSVYIKPTSEWINIITYSQKYGVHAKGWSVLYTGFILKNDSKWIIPLVAGIELFTIDPGYFSKSNYRSASINYYMAGISPLRKLNDIFYANIGFQILYGSEQLLNFNNSKTNNTVLGLTPFQGLVFIPKSKFGITLGLGIYEKFLNSMFYKNDFGVKFEAGIKF